MRMARRAGSHVAARAIALSTTATIAYVRGSVAVTPNNIADIIRVASNPVPMPITTAYTVRVRTDLYLVANQTKVWSADSTAIEKQNLFGVIDGIAKALTTQLRKDGLIAAR